MARASRQPWMYDVESVLAHVTAIASSVTAVAVEDPDEALAMCIQLVMYRDKSSPYLRLLDLTLRRSIPLYLKW